MRHTRLGKPLGELLVENGMITRDDLTRALEAGKKNGWRLGEALVALDIVSQDDLNWTLANQFSIPYLSISIDKIEPNAARLIPEELARRHHILPMMRLGDELVVLVDDPLNEGLFADVEKLTGLELNLALARTDEILATLDALYGSTRGATASPLRPGLTPTDIVSTALPVKDVAHWAADASGEKLFAGILDYVLAQRGTRLHFDATSTGGRLRLRREGMLTPLATLSPVASALFATRLRIAAGMVTGDTASPGAAPASTPSTFIVVGGGGPHAVRVTLEKTAQGESAVLDVAPARGKPVRLDDLGMPPKLLERVRGMVQRHGGLVTVTGPAGVGKIGVMQALAREQDAGRLKIIAVGPAAGSTESDGDAFVRLPITSLNGDSASEVAHAIARARRLDADVILVETLAPAAAAAVAVTTALGGPRVYVPLRSPDALGALAYYLALDINRSALAGALAGIIAVHRVRLLCADCKVKTTGPARLTKNGRKTVRPCAPADSGCPACHGTGYRGSAPVWEVLPFDSGLRGLIAGGKSMDEIGNKVRRGGFTAFADQALALYRSGQTSLEEIIEFV